MKIRILSQENIKKTITMKDAIAETKSAFIELANGRVQIPLRTALNIPTENGLSLFMPSFLMEQEQLGIKIVSVFPYNKEKKLPSVSGVILLLDSHTGLPIALLDAGYLTALRTGAVSGVATDLCAHSQASHVTIFGAGPQAYAQLDAVIAVRPITHVSLYSLHPNNTLRFANAINEKYPHINVDICDTIDSACVHSDIICTATNSKEPLIYRDDIKHPHCHINAIGSHNVNMHEVDVSILANAKIIVDQFDASLAEAGEIIRAVKEKVITKDSLLELGTLVNNPHCCGNLKESFTVFKSVGLAIQDVSIAHKTLQLAEEHSIGSIIDI